MESVRWRAEQMENISGMIGKTNSNQNTAE